MQASNTADWYEPKATGPALQAVVPASQHNMPSTATTAAPAVSSLIQAQGFGIISASVTSTQTGTLSIQPYLDAAGTIPQGGATSVSLTAGAAGVVNLVATAPFQSYTVTVTGTSATLTNFQILQQSSSAPAGTSSGGGSSGAVTQSGNWVVNQGTASAGFEKVTDGTNVVAVKAASTAAGTADPALVVTFSPNTATVPINAAQVGGLQTSKIYSSNGFAIQNVAFGSAQPTTDVNGGNFAAASGTSSAVVNDLGACCSFLVNLTAWTAGSSTGLDIFLQWSPDGGTTFFDIWQCEALTATGAVYIPALALPGRRRMRWVNRGGAATTATVTVTATGVNYTPPRQCQFFDRTSALLSGTASAISGGYDVSGCKTINARVSLGAATTPATYQLQVSDDFATWSNVGTATAAVANAVTTLSVTNVVARFARVIVTAAGSSQTGNYVSITGAN